MALSLAAPAKAADLQFKAPVNRGETRLWVEGGAFLTGGDNIQYGSGDPFFGGKGRVNVVGFGIFPGIGCSGTVNDNDTFGSGTCPPFNPKGATDPSVFPWVGATGAAGFDHQFAGTRWHINGEARAGVSWGKDSFTTALSILDDDPAFPDGITASANTEAKLTEWHWIADLGMGYEVFSGRAPLQVKFGLRIAEVAARTKVQTDGTLIVYDAGVVDTTASFSSEAKILRSFLGAGPRLGIEGEFPLWANWVLDYKGDAAILFGNTKISADSNFAISAAGPGFAFSANFPFNSYWSKPIYVWNFDMQAGIGWWVTPNWKMSASYRVDVFLDALRQNPDDLLPAQSIDRYFHGPKLTLTGRWH
jgi:hypothetical protein